MEKDNKIILVNQKNLTITGIKKVLGVSETSISLSLDNSAMVISGENMEVKKIDVESGIMEVDGKVICIKYLIKREKINLFKRIFK